MFGRKAIATLATSLTLGAGGLAVDASLINEVPIDKEEVIKGEVVKVKQVGNVVEGTFPWKGESGIKMKYDMGEPTVVEKVKDKRKKQVYFEPKQESFEYGLLLNEVPTTNTFCSIVENAENYDWFKQPPLTQEEIDEGAFRPDNVVNSYAVYHKTLKNHVIGQINYETGKAFHRYRPQAVDAKGDWVWGDSNYANGEVCDSFPQEWLDSATYPVKI